MKLVWKSGEIHIRLPISCVALFNIVFDLPEERYCREFSNLSYSRLPCVVNNDAVSWGRIEDYISTDPLCGAKPTVAPYMPLSFQSSIHRSMILNFVTQPPTDSQINIQSRVGISIVSPNSRGPDISIVCILYTPQIHMQTSCTK
jgi:hypothetical protein